MVARELIDALRKGNEGEIWWELDLLSRTPRWPRDLRALSREEALRLIERGGTATRAALAEHPDGRIREAALRALAPDATASLPTLLRRANDWVPIVARLAGERAAVLLPQADDATLQAILPLVFALTRQGRVDHDALVRAYLHLVRTRRGLARRIRKANRNGPVGEWASWRLVGEEETAQDLARERLRAGTPRLQLATARQMANEPNAWRTLLDSRNPQIRRLALDHAPPEALESALVDENAGVRNDARYLLGKRDYAAHYRSLLPAPGSISGLGETGGRGDAEAIRPLFDHPKPEVRRRAVEALGRLLGEDAANEVLAALRDPSRRVQRAAVDATGRMVLGLNADAITALDLSSAAKWRLLDRTPRWASLPAVLRHCDEFLRAEAWLALWTVRSRSRPMPPPAGAVDEIRGLLAEAEGALSEATLRNLREAVEFWS